MNWITRISTNGDITNLANKFFHGQIIMIDIDSSGGVFNIKMPDAKATKQNIFIFHKSDNSNIPVNIIGVNNQKFMNEATLQIIEQNRVAMLISTGSNWVILNGF